jgi:MSHA pilin protein MshA
LYGEAQVFQQAFQQKGLGVIEVVMMLVVLGLLASTAIPSFVSDRTDARQAAVDGVAGSLTSASAINYTVRNINKTNGVAINNCKDVVKALEGSLGDDYVVTSTSVAQGTKSECKVTHKKGEWAKFVAHGIS